MKMTRMSQTQRNFKIFLLNTVQEDINNPMNISPCLKKSLLFAHSYLLLGLGF